MDRPCPICNNINDIDVIDLSIRLCKNCGFVFQGLFQICSTSIDDHHHDKNYAIETITRQYANKKIKILSILNHVNVINEFKAKKYLYIHELNNVPEDNKKQYDIVVVLSHLNYGINLNEIIQHLKTRLKETGIIALAVTDIELKFIPESSNFFSRYSLIHLMARNNLEIIDIQKAGYDIFMVVRPQIIKKKKHIEVSYDYISEIKIKEYVKKIKK